MSAQSSTSRPSTRGWWPVLVVIVMIAAYASLTLPRGTVDQLIEEDGFYEWAGTIGLFAASVALAVAGLRLRRTRDAGGMSALKPWILLVLAAGLFFAAGEEISWGQRLLGIETPDSVREVNRQDEINLHNLGFLGNVLDVGFQLFWASMFVALPLLARFSERGRELLGRFLPIAPVAIALLLVANYVLAQASERVIDGDLYESSYPIVHSVNELKEAVVGIVLGIAAILILRRTPRPAAAPRGAAEPA